MPWVVQWLFCCFLRHFSCFCNSALLAQSLKTWSEWTKEEMNVMWSNWDELRGTNERQKLHDGDCLHQVLLGLVVCGSTCKTHKGRMLRAAPNNCVFLLAPPVWPCVCHSVPNKRCPKTRCAFLSFVINRVRRMFEWEDCGVHVAWRCTTTNTWQKRSWLAVASFSAMQFCIASTFHPSGWQCSHLALYETARTSSFFSLYGVNNQCCFVYFWCYIYFYARCNLSACVVWTLSILL